MAVIEQIDFAVIEGHRTLARQQQLHAEGRSRLDGVTQRSKHQETPSRAMDLMPWPPELHGVNIWQDAQRWAHFTGIVRGVAFEIGVKVRLGWDWNGDGSSADHRFVDSGHIEIV